MSDRNFVGSTLHIALSVQKMLPLHGSYQRNPLFFIQRSVNKLTKAKTSESLSTFVTQREVATRALSP